MPLSNLLKSATGTCRFCNQKAGILRRKHPDNADGTTGFMLQLQNGLLMLAELSADGILSAGTYDDSDQNATVTQMLNLL